MFVFLSTPTAAAEEADYLLRVGVWWALVGRAAALGPLSLSHGVAGEGPSG